jgi:hypothetical protein
MSDKEIDWSKKRLGFVLATIVLFLLGTYFYFNVQRSDSNINPEDLVQIDSLIISEKPTFQETRGKNARQWIEFKCIGYPKRFEIGSFDYACVNDNEILSELKVGDIISVKLLNSDIQDIRTETFSSKSNDIHSLVHKNKEFLSIDCRNKAAKNDNKFAYYMCFIMVPFTLVVSLFKNKPKIFGTSIDPTLVICLIAILVMLILRNDVFK